MNDLEPLTIEQARRWAYADHIETIKPNRHLVTVASTLTSYFRSIGVLPEHGRWINDYDTPSGATRYETLVDHFGFRFAVSLSAKHSVARNAYVIWVRQYITPEELVLLSRRRAVQANKEQLEETQEIRKASIDLQRALSSSAQGAIRGRRQLFVNYLRRRQGPCMPARTYRRWRGYEEHWMRFTRARDHLYDASVLPARGYHVRKDVAAVLGEEAVPLIFKAPLTTRDALATQIEELP